MKAWVIQITTLNAAKPVKNNIRVIALVSARRNVDFIKQYVENIYFILRMNLEGQKETAKYSKPYVPIKATSHSGCVVYCVNNPYYFIGELSEIIECREQNGVYWLKWKGVQYQKYSVDPITHYPVSLGEENPPIREAPQVDFQIVNFFR